MVAVAQSAVFPAVQNLDDVRRRFRVFGDPALLPHSARTCVVSSEHQDRIAELIEKPLQIANAPANVGVRIAAVRYAEVSSRAGHELHDAFCASGRNLIASHGAFDFGRRERQVRLNAFLFCDFPNHFRDHGRVKRRTSKRRSAADNRDRRPDNALTTPHFSLCRLL